MSPESDNSTDPPLSRFTIHYGNTSRGHFNWNGYSEGPPPEAFNKLAERVAPGQEVKVDVGNHNEGDFNENWGSPDAQVEKEGEQTRRQTEDSMKEVHQKAKEVRQKSKEARQMRSSSVDTSFLSKLKSQLGPHRRHVPDQLTQSPTSSPTAASFVVPNSPPANRPATGRGARVPHLSSLNLPDEWKLKPSESEAEWERKKEREGAQNNAINDIMRMTGLESVKEQLLRINSMIDIAQQQGASLKDGRFNIEFLGNAGTGKTTVARHYAKFLSSVGILPGTTFKETTGSRLSNEGVEGTKKLVEGVIKDGGGAVFIDEAYQLTSEHNSTGGLVLDFLLAEMENNKDKLVFIFAGYSKQMEKFFDHNPGLRSRVPYRLKFEDYSNAELLDILVKHVEDKYSGDMKAEEGLAGRFMRIAIMRLGRGRGTNGFGNARAVQNMFARIWERQAARIEQERRQEANPDIFYMTREDIIGPPPAQVMKESKAWKKLQEMIGLDSVKNAIHDFFLSVETNYLRELEEKPIVQFSLNRCFLGPPGTGKTTVAQLFGSILKDLNLLSNGEVVVKNPSNFIGAYIGHSEKNTRQILASTQGKVLVIDEAHMLCAGPKLGGSNADSFKTSVIDTIVAEVQSTPGEDRCVLLLGYEDQMKKMFQNANPGLSRRFDIETAFIFENYNDAELLQILELKLKQQELNATDAAKGAAIDLLSRARRDRPNFGNGGEVENILGRAKARSQRRLGAVAQITLEPVDFDPEHIGG